MCVGEIFTSLQRRLAWYPHESAAGKLLPSPPKLELSFSKEAAGLRANVPNVGVERQQWWR